MLVLVPGGNADLSQSLKHKLHWWSFFVPTFFAFILFALFFFSNSPRCISLPAGAAPGGRGQHPNLYGVAAPNNATGFGLPPDALLYRLLAEESRGISRPALLDKFINKLPKEASAEEVWEGVFREAGTASNLKSSEMYTWSMFS